MNQEHMIKTGISIVVFATFVSCTPILKPKNTEADNLCNRNQHVDKAFLKKTRENIKVFHNDPKRANLEFLNRIVNASFIGTREASSLMSDIKSGHAVVLSKRGDFAKVLSLALQVYSPRKVYKIDVPKTNTAIEAIAEDTSHCLLAIDLASWMYLKWANELRKSRLIV